LADCELRLGTKFQIVLHNNREGAAAEMVLLLDTAMQVFDGYNDELSSVIKELGISSVQPGSTETAPCPNHTGFSSLFNNGFLGDGSGIQAQTDKPTITDGPGMKIACPVGEHIEHPPVMPIASPFGVPESEPVVAAVSVDPESRDYR